MPKPLLFSPPRLRLCPCFFVFFPRRRLLISLSLCLFYSVNVFSPLLSLSISSSWSVCCYFTVVGEIGTINGGCKLNPCVFPCRPVGILWYDQPYFATWFLFHSSLPILICDECLPEFNRSGIGIVSEREHPADR